ncbi:long-chain fatty acid--CoA ligase [Brucella sp. RRSP16]|uniref:Long-chain-fatty-acid--CoA ligase n=1 Tax=Brucella intermedia GD04153 TaxID=2975438 RepID=A0AA42GVL8_9HYPH|nr:long-chain fatty acid--CoA ligase [Brucella intermedia]ERI14852.1 long-chain fatty acid--CoA ligase [Ochrobactrum sp. EGD-AQ16]PJT24652.1 long-chain-fatty-acid--CoA ligase [Ochrobactrum sp. 30A/1000/2015]PJT36605.1 long-chain-fatty-acid--CoA ligase [Ochrobactrum sp. 27A/999/2015]PJT42028.1 long-chain-fatty-acid--CoA ligase [Ochrobactrum sp. 23A/997/2015]KAB2696061.1 long-chain fatty acid--CoA ligase [Brucella intermedia]
MAKKTTGQSASVVESMTAGSPANGAPTQEKIWFKSYPAGVPHEIDLSTATSIGDMILASCRQFASSPAFTCMGKDLSYKELDEYSRALAAFLQSRGLVKGDRVAVMMPNILHYPIAFTAILRAGFVVVNVNPLYTPRELEHQLKDSGAKALIVLENFASTVEKTLNSINVPNIIVASMGDMHGFKGHIINLVVRRVKKMVPAWNIPEHIRFKDALAQGRALSFNPVPVQGSDLAFLQYTGGTTGISKGAMLTHSNILANVEQMHTWMEVAFRNKGKPKALNFVCALPLYHIFALTVNAMIGIKLGARNILIPNPRDIAGFVKELRKFPFHIFPGLNTLFNGLMNNPDFQTLDFKPLILTLGGGMAVQRPVAERWQKMTGCHITEGYGLSETSPVACANALDATEFSGTIGLPMPSTDVAIRDDDGNDLALGEVGEICVRGPQVMTGYWNRPDETKRAIMPDGFFRTGDMGFMDERGYTKIVDRKKDMILVSGFNVYPNEIEEVAAGHPGIVESAAIGIPNEHSGEVVKLFVVRSDLNLTEDEVKAYCAERLTNYKRPREVEFRESLPKSNVGKILRRELRD